MAWMLFLTSLADETTARKWYRAASKSVYSYSG